MKLMYDEIVLGEILTNHSMSIDDAIKLLDIDMDLYAQEQGWDDWDYECLSIKY